MTRSEASPLRQVLADGVYDAIKAMIMNREIEPGAKINMGRLATELDVSTTPLREALAKLEGESLVTKQPLVGYTAAPLLDAAGVDDLYELRLLLEPAAAGRAATTISEQQTAQLRSITAKPRAGADEVGADYDSYRLLADSDQRFHDLIAAASGSKLLVQTIQHLHPHAQLYRLHFQRGLDRTTIAEHRAIAAAIERGDAEGAAEKMTVHLRKSHARVRSALDKGRTKRVSSL